MRIMHISRASIMICRFLIPVIKAQKKRDHYVCVCCSDDSYAQKLRDSEIEVFPHQLKRNLNPFSIIKEIFRIKGILIEQKIDAIICHAPIAGGVGRIAAKLAKTSNIVYFVHGFTCAPAQNILKWLIWFCIEKLLGKVTDAALVMNDYDEKLCKSYHLVKNINKIFRIPGMGVDLDKFRTGIIKDRKQQIERELGIAGSAKIIFCTAYLVPEKGVFVLLEAAKQICASRSDVCFLLAGRGPYMDELKKLCAKYGLEEHFKILGWRDDVHELMWAVDIFVLPSYYWEGLPVSILEAMACAKPVIATRNRGCEDVVVDNETGFLVPLKQAVLLADKISILLDNEQLGTRMGQAGRQRVEKYFEFNYCTDKIVEALEKVIC